MVDDIKIITAILAAASLGSQPVGPSATAVDRYIDVLRELAQRHAAIDQAACGK